MKKIRNIPLSMPPDLLKEVDEIAARTALPRSEVMPYLILLGIPAFSNKISEVAGRKK